MIGKYIDKLENNDTPIKYYILFFVLLLFIRSILESYSGTSVLFVDNFFHVSFAYVFLISFVICTVQIFLKSDIVCVSKVVLLLTPVILVPPVVDFIVSKGEGLGMQYLEVHTWGELIHYFFTFFNLSDNTHVTPGVKVEIFLELLGVFIYAAHKKNYLKGLIVVAIIYVFFYLYAICPVIYSALGVILDDQIVFGRDITQREFIRMLLLSNILLALIYLAIGHRKFLRSIFHCQLMMRGLYFSLIILIGMVIALTRERGVLNPYHELLVELLLIGFSLCCYSQFASLIEKGSERTRLAHVFWIIGGTCALSVGFGIFVFFVTFSGFYYFCFMRPFCWGKIPFVPGLVVGVNTLLMLLVGHYYVTGSIFLPPFLSLYLFVVASVGASSKYFRRPKIWGAAMSLLLICFSIVTVDTRSLWFFAPMALVTYLLIGIAKFDQKYVWQSYIITLLGLISYLASTRTVLY